MRRTATRRVLGSLLALATTAVAPHAAHAGATESCTSERHEWVGDVRLTTSSSAFDSGMTIPVAAAGEALTVTQSAFTVRDLYAEQDPDLTRSSDNEQHESFALVVGGLQFGALSPDLPDSVAAGAVSDWDSGELSASFGTGETPGGAVAFRHASRFGFAESPNSVQVGGVTIELRRCVPNPDAVDPVATVPAGEAPCTVPDDPCRPPEPPVDCPCEHPTTTTTITPEPSTAPAETTTTMLVETVTTAPPATTTTTVPVTTTHPDTTTTVAGTTTTLPVLPETGQTSGWIVGTGGASVLAGLSLLRLRSRPAR